MNELFEIFASALNPQTAHLEIELAETEAKIKKLTVSDSYLDAVHKSFPYGVGGSGRNNYRLNKRKERNLERTIDAAVKLSPLYTKRDNLIKQIEDIKSGKAAKKEQTVIDNRMKRAEYWRNLKVGDELNLGNSNGNPTILKKSRLSVITTNATKWTASEVIGREAAKLI